MVHVFELGISTFPYSKKENTQAVSHPVKVPNSKVPPYLNVLVFPFSQMEILPMSSSRGQIQDQCFPTQPTAQLCSVLRRTSRGLKCASSILAAEQSNISYTQ